MPAANVIRELLVRLGVNVNPQDKKEIREFDRRITQLKRTMEDVAGAAVRAGTALAGAVVAGATAAGVLARQVGAEAEQIERTARGLNLTRREYQEMLHVVQTFGADSRELADAFLQINEAADRALGGSTEMVESFAAIGVQASELRGLNPAQLFELIADRASRATDRSAALATVSRLLGEEASRKLGPALLMGAEGIRRLRREAHELGVVMDDDALRTAKAVQVQWRRLTFTVRGLRNEVGVLLAPAVTRVAQGMTAWLRTNREMITARVDQVVRNLTATWAALDTLVRAIPGGWRTVFMNLATATGLLLLIANLGKVQAALAAIRVATTALGVVWGAVATAMGISLAPVVALFAGFAFFLGLAVLGIQDLIVWWQGGNSVMGAHLDLLERFIPLFGGLRALANAVGAAFVQGFRNALGWVNAVVQGLTPLHRLLDAVVGLVSGLINGWRRLQELAAQPLRSLANEIRHATALHATSQAVGQDALRRQIAGAVQGQVDQAVSRVNQVDRSITGGTVHQTNMFLGPPGLGVEDALASSMRRAWVNVTGGDR